MNNDKFIEQKLKALSKSKFRSSFHLNDKDLNTLKTKGFATIQKHAHELIIKRLAPEIIINDGKQTPYKGHPVFVSQHATATCCRKCLEKWYGIQQGKALCENEIKLIVKINISWLEKELLNTK